VKWTIDSRPWDSWKNWYGEIAHHCGNPALARLLILAMHWHLRQSLKGAAAPPTHHFVVPIVRLLIRSAAILLIVLF